MDLDQASEKYKRALEFFFEGNIAGVISEVSAANLQNAINLFKQGVEICSQLCEDYEKINSTEKYHEKVFLFLT